MGRNLDFEIGNDSKYLPTWARSLVQPSALQTIIKILMANKDKYKALRQNGCLACAWSCVQSPSPATEEFLLIYEMALLKKCRSHRGGIKE